MCITQSTDGGRGHPDNTQRHSTQKHADTHTGGKMKTHPFVPAYPVTEVVSGHPHMCDQEYKHGTVSMEGKKTKQKTGISHKELWQKGKGFVLHNVHMCILNTSNCA